MRSISKLIGACTVIMSGLAALGVGSCSQTPNGHRVTLSIDDYPGAGQIKRYDINEHQFNGASKVGDFSYQYPFTQVASSFLNLINLRYETRTTDPALPMGLYDSAIAGKITHHAVGHLTPDKKQVWNNFWSDYNNTSVGYSFTSLELKQGKFDPSASDYGTYQKLALIPDIHAMRDKKKGKQYFSGGKSFSIAHSLATLVNFQVIKNKLDILNSKYLPAAASDYSSRNRLITQNARTAIVRVGQLKATMQFDGHKKFELSAWFNHLVAKLKLTSWTFDGKNFCQGWVFDNFDFYDYDFASFYFPSDFTTYHRGDTGDDDQLIVGYHNTPSDPTAIADKGPDHSGLPNLTRRGSKVSYPEYRCGVLVGSLKVILAKVN